MAKRGFATTGVCPFCGEVDSVFHRIWRCVSRSRLREEIFGQELIARAIAGGDGYLLFSRGLVSAPLPAGRAAPSLAVWKRCLSKVGPKFCRAAALGVPEVCKVPGCRGENSHVLVFDDGKQGGFDPRHGPVLLDGPPTTKTMPAQPARGPRPYSPIARASWSSPLPGLCNNACRNRRSQANASQCSWRPSGRRSPNRAWASSPTARAWSLSGWALGSRRLMQLSGRRCGARMLLPGPCRRAGWGMFSRSRPT